MCIIVSVSQYAPRQSQLPELDWVLKVGHFSADFADFHIDKGWVDLHSDFDYLLQDFCLF